MSKKQSKNGVTLTINPPTSNYGIFNIVDIDVQPGVDSVTLDIDGLARYNNFNVRTADEMPDIYCHLRFSLQAFQYLSLLH